MSIRRSFALGFVGLSIVSASVGGLAVGSARADWGGNSRLSPLMCSYGAHVYTTGSATLRYPDGTIAGYLDIRWSDWCPTSNWARLTSTIVGRHAVSISEQGYNNAAGADDSGVSVNVTPVVTWVGRTGRVCAYADIYTWKGHAAGLACG